MLDVEVRSATEKESAEPCSTRNHPIKPGESVVVCRRCLVVSHVACWNELGRCAIEGCTNVGAIAVRAPEAGGCPYCAEPLPSPAPAQCPHCKEFLNAVMLKQSLEVERYNRCPGGVRGVAVWYKFQGGLTAVGGMSLMCAGLGDARLGLVPFGFFLAAMGVGFWKVGSGVRHGRRWARSWAIGLSVLQIFSRGFLIGLLVLITLNSAPARAYFADRD